MIQSHSQNITVPTNSSIPFNSLFKKGCTVAQNGAATFQFNRRGLYLVAFDASAFAAATAGNITIQLYRNGVLDPGGFTQAASTAAADIEALSFSTLVQVPCDNTCDCGTAPVTVQIRNIGVPATFVQANAVITKLC